MGITIPFLIQTLGRSVGLVIAGRLFACRPSLIKAVLAAAISSGAYALLSSSPALGGLLSFVVLVGLVGLWGRGDRRMDAFLTAAVSGGVVLIFTLAWASASASMI